MTNPLEAKSKLYRHCVDFVENRLKTVQKTIAEIQESLNSETKSSAGDKHETGRAMLQLEREKAGHQLAEVEKLMEHLSKIDAKLTSKNIGLGSIVFTTQANYFIAISAGEIEVENTKFFAISTNTPIGLLLMGKRTGNMIIFRDKKFTIENVY